MITTMTFYFSDNQPALEIEAPEDAKEIKALHDHLASVIADRRNGAFRFALLRDSRHEWVAFDPTHINRITGGATEGATLGLWDQI